MPQTLREFFVQEATEYLDKLSRALAAPGEPDADGLRRLARALRGSARMADQEAISVASAALQSVAADVASGHRPWDREIAHTCQAAVSELRALVESLTESPPDDLAERAHALAERLGAPETKAREPEALTPQEDSRFRRYLGNELRGLALEIAQASEVLERDPRNRDPLKRLLRRIRPLQGVQALGKLAGVGSALAAVEEVILRIADTAATVGPGHLALFRRAQQALDDVAGTLLEGGPLGERPVRGGDIEDLKQQVLDTAAQREITWISDLFHEDPGPHIEDCPMAERGAGSWEAFFKLEATGSLDTADRLRSDLNKDNEGARHVAQRLAYTFRQLRERAVTFGHTDLGRIARRAGAAIRAQLTAPSWRLQALASDLVVTISGLREYLDSANPETRRRALERAEGSLEQATHPLNEPPVPVESLLYEPSDAMARAVALRDEVERALDTEGADVEHLRPLLDEVFALIELAAGRSAHSP